MRRFNGARAAVIVITALLLIYLVAIGGLAWGLITSGEILAVIMGVVLVVLPLVGAYVVVRDLLFVRQSNRLIALMAQAGELPEDDLPRQASGRYERTAADTDFARWKQRVERQPDDWRSWVLLALAYRASCDSPRARSAMRRAIALEHTRKNNASE